MTTGDLIEHKTAGWSHQGVDDAVENVERRRLVDPALLLDVERLLEEADGVERRRGLERPAALQQVPHDRLELLDLVGVLEVFFLDKGIVLWNIFCSANLRPLPLTAFAKSLALALDGFDLYCPRTKQ